MCDLDIENTCRICLEKDVKYYLFGSSNDIQSQIFQCFNEKIENIEGYPCNVCSKCYDTINLICEFKRKFQESCKILEDKLIQLQIKNENEFSDIEIELETFSDITNVVPKEKPKPEDILNSLKDILVKRINNNTEQTPLKNNTKKDQSSVLSNNKAKKFKIKPTSSTTALKCSKSLDENKKTSKSSRTRLRTKTVQHKPKESTSINNADKPLPIENSAKESVMTNVQKCPDENEDDKQMETENQNQTLQTRLCNICGSTFSRYSNLLQHKKVKCNGKLKFKCEICPREYNAKYSLKEHILKIHENVKNAICETCGKKFFNAKHLAEHVKYVHKKIRKNPKLHKCRFCERTYHYKRGIVIHERSVHTGERPAVCSVCDSAFYDEVYLREHMRLHTGSVPFRCPICNKGFPQRGHMKSHMRHNHSKCELGPDILSNLKPCYLKFLKP